jgi:26S proteasome regulatory subunit N9
MSALDKISEAYPHLAVLCEQIQDFHRRQLWHQLTDCLIELVNDPVFASGTHLYDLYNSMLKLIARKLSPLRVSQIVYSVSKQLDRPVAITFLTDFLDVIKMDSEATILITLYITEAYIQIGEEKNYKDRVSASEKDVAITPVGNEVMSQLYKCKLMISRLVGDATLFYRNSLLYLAHTPLHAISPAEQNALAAELCMAALLGESVYQLGELLLHPIFMSLEGSNHAWLHSLVIAFSKGDLDSFNAITARNAVLMQSHPPLVNGQVQLREKIRVFALMELARDRPANARTMPFEVIAQRASLNIAEVEFLVMKAVSLGLVKGSIDQVGQKVVVKWVQPRVLEHESISRLCSQLETWQKQVEVTAQLLQSEGGDMMVASQ